MVQAFHSGNYYCEKVHEQIHHLELLLNELRNELPSSGPLEFAKANINLIDLVSKFFIKEIQLQDKDEDIIKCCKKYLKLLQDITENVIPLLEGINDAFIPSEFLLTLAHQTKELAKKLVFSEDFDLRLCPRWDFNYGIYAYKNFIRSFLADLPTFLLPELLEGLPSFPELFVFINYPRTESRNILLHSIMIHELGHLVDFQTGISKTIKDKDICIIDKDSFNTLFQSECKKEELKPENKRRDKDQIKENLSTKCSEIIEEWLKEFVSDLVATHLLGPAYFFALYEISILTDDMHNYSESHPSSGIRLRVISEELYEVYLKENNNNPNNIKPGKVIKNEKIRKLLLRLYKDLKRKEKSGGFKPSIDDINYYYYQVAYNTILPKRALLRKKVRQDIGEFSYDVDRFNNEVELLFKDIRKGIPPCEIRSNEDKENKAASFASILNASWLAYLFGMDEFYSVVSATKDADKLKALDNFNELLFKGIESTYILQE